MQLVAVGVVIAAVAIAIVVLLVWSFWGHPPGQWIWGEHPHGHLWDAGLGQAPHGHP